MPLFRHRARLEERAAPLPLASYQPSLTLERLLTGIDNLRQDVFLSPKFMDLARTHTHNLIVHYGDVSDLVAVAAAAPAPPSPAVKGPRTPARLADAGDFAAALADLLANSLNRAKREDNLAIHTLCRLAVVKFLRRELEAQFAGALELCRASLKFYETPRQASAPRIIALRERAAQFHQAKKIILRKIGQELFALLRELEKTSLARMRRSLFGEAADAEYELFLNRLLFTEDGRDDILNAEHYVMLGNYVRDPDRFETLHRIACDYLRSQGYGGPPASPESAPGSEEELQLESWLNEPENAQRLLGGGAPQESTLLGRRQRVALNAWVEKLRQEQVMPLVVASYEAAPLLAQYSPPLNPQQLKNALISRSERRRVEALLPPDGKLSTENLRAAVERVRLYRAAELDKLAARFLKDFLRYHRDRRRLEVLNSALDGIHLIGADPLRKLSAINRTLYEFLLTEEQKPAEEKIVHHVILKADVRDSTLLTRTLLERGLNPASHFSLNFYEPINKLLPKYSAEKLFIEGDAVILALFEREGDPPLGVARACVLAKEIIEIVRGYNELSEKSGLPALELGIGIAYQDAAPMYLMDGNTSIMISPALNASDRLSACSKSARRFLLGSDSLFNVFAFQTIDDADAAGQPEEFLIRYNIDGIVLDEAAFRKLDREILLAEHQVPLPTLWEEGQVRLFSGVVPVAPGVFHKLIAREARVPHIDAREFQLKDWTDRRYYEICTNAAIYEYLENQAAGAAGTVSALASR